MICASDQVTDIYSPRTISFWLRHWELLDGMVLGPATTRHHLERHHREYNLVPGTPCEPVTFGVGVPSFNMAEVRADIEVAVAHLSDPLERGVLERVMRGDTLTGATAKLHRQKARVIDAFHSGVARCAATLGYVEPALPPNVMVLPRSVRKERVA